MKSHIQYPVINHNGKGCEQECVCTHVCACSAAQSCLAPCDPMELARLLCPWDSPGKNTQVGCHASSGDHPNPGIEARSPASQVDSLPSEPPGIYITESLSSIPETQHCKSTYFIMKILKFKF